MKIAVNTRFLLSGALEGVGWYTYEVFKRLVLAMPDHTFYFFFDRKYDDQFVFADNVVPIVLKPQSRHPLLWYLWFDYAIPRALEKYKINLFISPDGFCSLRTKVRQILIVHDLAFEHFDDNIKWHQKLYLKRYAPRFCEQAEHILTVSEFSRQDIIDKYGIDSNKITVAHNGVSPAFTPLSDAERKAQTQQFESDYFLYVGALHPRKNIPNLLRAFDSYKEETSDKRKLIIVGRKAWGNREMEVVYRYMKYKSDVIFQGHLDQKQLNKVYGGAVALVYPSFFEGFGLPVLEAMKCGIPVITSKNSSMSEICGDAAIYIDPNDFKEITSAMRQVVQRDISEQLISKGAKRAEQFNWDKATIKLLQIVEGFK